MSDLANGLRIICLNDVEPEPVDYIWKDRFAAGKITMTAGDPGTGKTSVQCDMMARISKGDPWPDGGRAPRGSVLILTAEDGLADTLRPRLEAADADLSRIHSIEAVMQNGKKDRSFNLQDDLDKLENAVQRYGDVKMISIDPVTAYMGKNIDSHKTTDVRAVLEPLTRFTERTKVGMFLISHPPKGAQSKAINGVTGSLAFSAGPRIVQVTMQEPETDRRLLLSVKNNLGQKAPGIGYRIGQRQVSKGIVAAHVIWDNEPVTMTADEAMQRSSSESSSKLGDAKELLREELSAGPVPAKDIIAIAERQGITEITLMRARKTLGVDAKKTGFDGGWVWTLKGQATQGDHRRPSSH